MRNINKNIKFLIAGAFVAFLAIATALLMILTDPAASPTKTAQSKIAPTSTVAPTQVPSPTVVPTNSFQLAATNSIAGGHSAPVTAVAFSPDSKILATASADTLIKLWNVSGAATALILSQNCTLYNYPYPLSAMAFSPNGKQLATGDTGGGLKLWNLPCGTEPISLPQAQGSVRVVSFSPDGKFLVSGGADNIVRLWDVANHQLVASYDNGRSGINDISWSPDSLRLAFVSTAGAVKS